MKCINQGNRFCKLIFNWLEKEVIVTNSQKGELIMKRLVLLLFCVGLMGVTASAAILNGDFESGTYQEADNWTELPSAVDQVYYHASRTTPNPSGPYNSGRALMMHQIDGYGAQQVLSSVEDSYAFSFSAGYRNDAVTDGDLTLVVSVVDTATGLDLDSESITISDPGKATGGLSDPAWGAWAPYTVTFDIDTTGVAETALRFTNPGGKGWTATAMVDNVVPEPVTMLLLGFGGLSVLRRRR